MKYNYTNYEKYIYILTIIRKADRQKGGGLNLRYDIEIKVFDF